MASRKNKCARYAAILFSAMASSVYSAASLAAPPLTTDDASTLDPGACQVETERQHFNRRTELDIVAACNFFGDTELAIGKLRVVAEGAPHAARNPCSTLSRPVGHPLPHAGEGLGGETGNSRSMLRARRTAYRCSGMCALQGRACQQLQTVSYSYEMLNRKPLRGVASGLSMRPATMFFCEGNDSMNPTPVALV